MKKWKRALSGLLSTAMVLSVVMPLPFVNQEAEAADNDFKIASFNIAAKGAKTKEIGALMREQDIDFAGFQEVDKYTGRNNKDMLKEISEAAGAEYDYYFRKSIDFSGGEYGIGILASSDLTNEDGADLNAGGYEGRGWQRAEMQVGDKTVAVYNTHLTWEDYTIRLQQMRDVFDAMENDETEYKVLTGDFNAQESNDEFDVYLRNYTIANGKDGKWLDTYIPFDASMKTNAIDNIITSRNIKINEVETVEADGIGSDHRVLMASCELLEEEQVSTQLLDKKVKQANELLKMTDVYTEKTLAALKKAVDASADVKDTQDAVNEAVDKLDAAISGLKRNPVPRSKAVAWWDFDGDEPMKDKTDRGNDGVEKGRVSFVPGLANLGNALCTNDGYVSVAKKTEDLNLGTSDFSVGFWYQASNPGTWSAVLGDKNWNSGANPGIAVVQGQGQFYTTYAANGCGQQENIVRGTAGKVYDGKWHYIAAVLDRDAESKLYVDGQMIASTSIESTADKDATVPNPFNIGADGNGGYGIDSLIDDVKVYRTVLTPEEIADEYELNRDKSEAVFNDMVTETEAYLTDLAIDPEEVKVMPAFESEDGSVISKIFCSENDVTIDDKGNILRQPLVDKKVQITYIVQKNNTDVAYDEGVMVKNKWITVKGKEKAGKNAQPDVVPTMQEWSGADSGKFAFKEGSRIIVSTADWEVLGKAAEITKSDIKELFDVNVEIAKDGHPKAGDVVLTFANGDKKLGEQGYELEIGEYVTIRGTEYRGVFFGTRSLLQGMITSGDNTIACGTAVDYPNYEIRKFMLDIGRKYFPMWYLKDLMKYASWFKLTDFQSHISEDTFNDYSAFRLESDIPHLTSTDGYYTKQEYRDFQDHAADYGIRVITEIDGPAHSRRFIELGKYEDAPEKYKNLGLDGTHFNLSEAGGARERVFNLMDEVLEEFLGGPNPVITTDAFNIGMDEYSGNQNDLRAYAVHMYDKIVNKYGKTAFAWDSNASLANANYPKEMYPMDDIVIDFWKWEEVSGGLKKLMDQGYKVVNGDHRWYIVPGAQIGFYDYTNQKKVYNELSAGNMMGWYGNGMIFPEGHPSIAGGTMLLWNDRGMFAGYTVNDIFARQRSQYPYLAQAYWYGKEDETFEEFKEKVDEVEVGPGLDNLYKDIDSKDEQVYNFDMEELTGNVVKDQSGNGYDATVKGAVLKNGPDGKQLTFNGDGYMKAQHKALKWPYTAMFDLMIDEKQTGDIVLFEEIMPKQGCVEKDGNMTGQEKRVIVMKEQADGTYRMTYSRENFNFEHNYTFKKGQPYRIAFSSDESKPTGGEYAKWNQPNTLHVNGELVSTLQGPAKPEGFKGTWWVDTPSMNMPLETIGKNLVGSLDNFRLYNRLLSNEEIKALGSLEGADPTPEPENLALNKPTTASSRKNDSLVAEFATDGNKGTRWGSNYNSSTNDPFDKVEWLNIDLKKSYALGTVKLYWENAYAQEYTVQVSEDGKTYTDALKVTGGNGGEEVLDLAGAKGRYLRIYCTKAVPSNDSWQWNYGYSLFEVEAYEYEGVVTDKAELQKAIERAAACYASDKYTEETWNVMQEALAAANEVYKNAYAAQEDVDAAATALNAAIDGLVRVYEIKVNGEVKASGVYNTKATVTAPVEDGKRFTGWLLDGKIISTDETFTFYISQDMDLEPCYEIKEVEPFALLTNKWATLREDGKSNVTFVGQLVIPEGYKIVNAGLVWSSKDGTDLTLGSGLKPTYVTRISETGQFSVTIKGMPHGRFLRGRIFATVEKDGVQTTVYSEEGKVNAK